MPKNKEDQAGPPRSGPSASKGRGNTAVWVALALLIGFAGGVFIGRQFQPAPLPQNATLEEPQADLAARVALADKALRQSVLAMRPTPPEPQVVSVEEREHNGQRYSFQTLRLPHTDRQALHDRLVKELALLVPSAKLTRVTSEAWDISIAGLPTHRLALVPETGKAEPPAKAVKGRLAIVIDDMGEDVALAQDLTKLGVPVAFSIWPDSGHREAVLKIAKAAGREIFIHMPMQPQGYPAVNPGPNPLLLTMTADQIRNAMRRAINRVHGAIGVNNHMGSAFTEQNLGMRVALTTMQEAGLFFLDSRTTASSVGIIEAKRMGLRSYQRDVFLDNELSVPAILKQLRKGEALALEKGHAIVIGHPHKETVKALRQWLKEKDAALQVVNVSSLPAL